MTSINYSCRGFAAALRSPILWAIAAVAGIFSSLLVLLLFRGMGGNDFCTADGFVQLSADARFATVILPLFLALMVPLFRPHSIRSYLIQFPGRRALWLEMAGRIFACALFAALSAVLGIFLASFAASGGVLTNFESKYSAFYGQTRILGGVSFGSVLFRCSLKLFYALFFEGLLMGTLSFLSRKWYLGLLAAIAACCCSLESWGWLFYPQIRCSYLSILEGELSPLWYTGLVLLLFTGSIFLAGRKKSDL